MIQYTKSDGTKDKIENPYAITFDGTTFTVTIRRYGYDEYDFWDIDITDIVELKII